MSSIRKSWNKIQQRPDAGPESTHLNKQQPEEALFKEGNWGEKNEEC